MVSVAVAVGPLIGVTGAAPVLNAEVRARAPASVASCVHNYGDNNTRSICRVCLPVTCVFFTRVHAACPFWRHHVIVAVLFACRR